MSTLELSAIVITHNEEIRIKKCLESLQFCKEIIVVDSYSTDLTVKVATPLSSKVIQNGWVGYTEQRNFSVNQAKYDWILSLDADEVISPELEAEIRTTFSRPLLTSGYFIPRKTFHSGKWIRHGGWYPNYVLRCFKKIGGKWVGDNVHERWETTGTVGTLRGSIHHFSFKNISDQVLRNNNYSSLAAQSLRQNNISFSVIKMMFKPLIKFLETYAIKRGFLDGYPGFMISISAAYSVFLKWAKLWELEKSEQS